MENKNKFTIEVTELTERDFFFLTLTESDVLDILKAKAKTNTVMFPNGIILNDEQLMQILIEIQENRKY